MRGSESIFANLNYVVSFLVKQAECSTELAYLNVWSSFQGHLAESWKLQFTAAPRGRSSPGITSKFTLRIDLNVTWPKSHAESQRIPCNLVPLWSWCPVCALLAELCAHTSHGTCDEICYQRAVDRIAASSSLFPCVLRRWGSSIQWPCCRWRGWVLSRLLPVSCNCFHCSFTWNDTFWLAGNRNNSKVNQQILLPLCRISTIIFKWIIHLVTYPGLDSKSRLCCLGSSEYTDISVPPHSHLLQVVCPASSLRKQDFCHGNLNIPWCVCRYSVVILSSQTNLLLCRGVSLLFQWWAS